MRTIPIDTSALTFIHFGEVEPALAQDKTQRVAQDSNIPLWKVPVVVLSPASKTPEGDIITVPNNAAPKFEQGVEIRFRGLRARSWSMGTSSGISLSADGVESSRPKAS
ncbi:MAG: hypothetical protein ACYDB2_07650 [Acidimicrobiales bacterium]